MFVESLHLPGIAEAVSLTTFSYLLYSWCSGIWDLDSEESAPPMASGVLEIVNSSPLSMLLIYTQTNSEPTPSISFIKLSHTKCTFPLALNHPRTRYWPTKDHRYSPEPTEVIQTLQSWTYSVHLPYLALSFLWKLSRRLWAMLSPLPLLPPDQRWCFRMWPCGSFSASYF